MKRYDLYRLVCEQVGGGGNPPGGEGGGSSPPKKSQLRIDPKLVTHRRFIGKPQRPEIGKTERRPVSPRDVFGDLLKKHQEFLDFNLIFYEEIAALLQSFENMTPEEVENALEDFEQMFRDANHHDPEGQMEILRNILMLQNIDANGNGSLGEGFRPWYNVQAGLILVLIGNRLPNSNAYLAFAGAAIQELGYEMMVQTGLLAILDITTGQPIEQQKSIIEQYITDTLGFAQDSPETLAYIVDYVQAYFEHIRQNGEDAPFIYENAPAEGIMSQVLQIFLASQNASTLNQPVAVLLQAAFDGRFNQTLSVYDAATFRRGGRNWTRIRGDVKFTESVARLFRVVFRRGGTAFSWRAFGTALGSTATSFGTGILQILLLEFVLFPLAGFAGFYLGEGGKYLSGLLMNQPELLEYFVRVGLLTPEKDPLTGETTTEWSWNEDLINTLLLQLAEAEAADQVGEEGDLSPSEYEQLVQQIFTEYLGTFNSITDTVLRIGGEIGDFLSDLWNRLKESMNRPGTVFTPYR